MIAHKKQSPQAPQLYTSHKGTFYSPSTATLVPPSQSTVAPHHNDDDRHSFPMTQSHHTLLTGPWSHQSEAHVYSPWGESDGSMNSCSSHSSIHHDVAASCDLDGTVNGDSTDDSIDIYMPYFSMMQSRSPRAPIAVREQPYWPLSSSRMHDAITNVHHAPQLTYNPPPSPLHLQTSFAPDTWQNQLPHLASGMAGDATIITKNVTTGTASDNGAAMTASSSNAVMHNSTIYPSATAAPNLSHLIQDYTQVLSQCKETHKAELQASAGLMRLMTETLQLASRDFREPVVKSLHQGPSGALYYINAHGTRVYLKPHQYELYRKGLLKRALYANLLLQQQQQSSSPLIRQHDVMIYDGDNLDNDDDGAASSMDAGSNNDNNAMEYGNEEDNEYAANTRYYESDMNAQGCDDVYKEDTTYCANHWQQYSLVPHSYDNLGIGKRRKRR